MEAEWPLARPAARRRTLSQDLIVDTALELLGKGSLDTVSMRRVAQALDSLGIRLVDHLVLAGDTIVSFRARGLL